MAEPTDQDPAYNPRRYASSTVYNGRSMFLAKWGPLSGLAVTIIGTSGYGLIYANTLRNDLDNLKSNVLSLNTPLSQRVFSLEARVGENGRIQTDQRLRLDTIDANGTSQNKVLKKDVDALRAEVAGSASKCADLHQKVEGLSSGVVETKVRLQYLIEAITPHDARRK